MTESRGILQTVCGSVSVYEHWNCKVLE